MQRTTIFCACCACLALFVCMPVSAQTYSYRETTGGRVMEAVFSLEPVEDGLRVNLVETKAGETVVQRFEVDASMATRTWHYLNERGNSSFTAVRQGDTITLSGLHHGKAVKRSYAAGSVPWNQVFTLGLRQFVLSGKERYNFWAIGTSSPGDLQLVEFAAVRGEREVLRLGGRECETVRVRMSFAGLKAPLWHADCWFRESDGLYLRFQARNGPAAPLTVAELVREEK